MVSTIANNMAGSGAGLGPVRAEFRALTSACGIYYLDWRAKIAVRGPDRARWLNSMATNKIRDLAVNHGVYCFLLNPQGHILGDFYAYNRGEYFLIDTDRAQLENLLTIFRRHIIMDKVEAADVGEQLVGVGVSGPAAGSALKDAGFESLELQRLQVTEMNWQGLNLALVRNDNPAIESYEIWGSPGDLGTVRDAVVKSGAMAVGANAVELFRIAAGVPRYGQDIRERDLPQETEQQRALNFNKGCYIGQEVVERIRSRGNVHRTFTGFNGHGIMPQPGTKIQADSKDIGEVTSSALLPGLEGDRAVALGYIRREFLTAATEFQAGEAQITPAALPFDGIFGS